MHGPEPPVDWAVWTRVNGIHGHPLDMMKARLGRSHFAPHAHEEYSIGACFQGVEVIRVRGELYYSGVDSIVLLEPGVPHTGGPAVDDGMAYRVLYPPGSLLPGGTPDGTRFRGPIIEDAQLAAELRAAHRALTAADDPLEGESRLFSFLDALVRRHAVPSGALDREPGPSDAERIARTVMDDLGDRLTAPPSLAEVSAGLGMSRYQVLRAFREAVGMPPYAWLAQHRVHRARRLLERGHRPAEAAVLTGFADQAHMTRWFRRVLGVTPGAFRNSVQDSARHPA